MRDVEDKDVEGNYANLVIMRAAKSQNGLLTEVCNIAVGVSTT